MVRKHRLHENFDKFERGLTLCNELFDRLEEVKDCIRWYENEFEDLQSGETQKYGYRGFAIEEYVRQMLKELDNAKRILTPIPSSLTKGIYSIDSLADLDDPKD